MTAPTGDTSLDPIHIAAATMREHLAAGRARPLLPGHWPVPTCYDGHWYHLPTASNAGFYVRVSAELATRYDQLARRHRRIQTVIDSGVG